MIRSLLIILHPKTHFPALSPHFLHIIKQEAPGGLLMKKVAIIGSPSLHVNYQSALKNVSCQAVIFPDTSYIQKHPNAFDGLLLPGGGDVFSSLEDYTALYKASAYDIPDIYTNPVYDTPDIYTNPAYDTPGIYTDPAYDTPDIYADPAYDISDMDADPVYDTPDMNTDPSSCHRLDLEQLLALHLFLKQQKPVFGICKGMQLISLYFRGTIREVSNQNMHRHPEKDTFHPADNLPGSFLHDLFGPHLLINSSHHQSIDTPGKNLQIIQCTHDREAEAVSHLFLPVIGTQWHPERMPKLPQQDAALLFRYFVSLL